MSILSSVQNALHFADNAIQNGAINVTVENPTVEVSAKEAVKFAQPYLIALAAIMLVGLVFLIQKRTA